MAVNSTLLAILDALFLLDEAILAVKLALDDDPDSIELKERLSDLQTKKDELRALRKQLQESGRAIPPPDPALIAQIQPLVAKVEAATNAGAAAGAMLAVTGEALTLAGKVLSHGAGTGH